MLFSGCCAVSVEPPVCAWKRSASAFGLVAPKRSRITRAHTRRAARNFATSWKKSLCALKKNESRAPNSSGDWPGLDRGGAVRDPVGDRERELLHRRRARLANVVPGDRDRVPRRDPLRAVGEEIGGEPHRRARREDVVPARDVLLEDVVLHRPAQRSRCDALLLRHQLVEQEQQRRGRVDRHRRRRLVEGDPAEQDLHVGDRVDRDAGAADLAERARIVRVHPDCVGRSNAIDRPSGRARGGSDNARSTPPPRRNPRTAASSTAARDTCRDTARGCTGTRREARARRVRQRPCTPA